MRGGSKANNERLRKLHEARSKKGQEISDCEGIIRQQEIEIQQLHAQIKEENKKIKSAKDKLREKRIKHLRLQQNAIGSPRKNKFAFSILHSTVARRRHAPTNKNLGDRIKRARLSDTMAVCQAIHGATKDDSDPAVDGMLDTLATKCQAASLAPKILNLRPALKKSLQKSLIRDWSKDFFLSQQNILRSLNVYYAHDVMGKNKYRNVRRANRSRFTNFNVPNYISYPKLSTYIHSIDIGKLEDVKELAHGMVEEEIPNGCFRDCKPFLLRLA